MWLDEKLRGRGESEEDMVLSVCVSEEHRMK